LTFQIHYHNVVVKRCISRFSEKETEKSRCFGCNGNMGCFIKKLYTLLALTEKNKSLEYDYEVAHFAPQTWYCNFKNSFDNYIIIMYEEGDNVKLAGMLDNVFKRAGVSGELRTVISEELLVGGTPHKTAGSVHRYQARRTLFEDKELLTLVVQMYYYDFVVFDYSLPVLI
ncbi:hypothetical protein OESDEN_03030, partial [Oesophagostomum dentatum]